MNTMLKKLLGVALALSSLIGLDASAAAVVTSGNGNVMLGVEDLGATGTGTGLFLKGVGDAITPGCYCEGWGAGYATSTGHISGYSANDNGSANVTGISAVGATSVVRITGSALQVTQSYAASGASGALIVDHVTLTNTSAAAISDVRYSRATDWDIPPTAFNEFVTIAGHPASALIFSNNNGFNAPDPFADNTANCRLGGSITNCSQVTNIDFTTKGPADQGSFFTFTFGSLLAGASVSFDVLYGADYSASAMLADLANVGASIYVLGYSSSSTGAPADGIPGTGVFAFGFAGAALGGTPIGATPGVPEPETVGLLGLGLVGLLAARRRKLVK